MRIIPNGDKILVKPEEVETVSKSGLILSINTAEQKSQGVVVEVGNGKINDDGSRRPMRFVVGQRVIYGKFAGDEVEMDGVVYRIIRDVEVLASIEPSNNKEV